MGFDDKFLGFHRFLSAFDGIWWKNPEIYWKFILQWLLTWQYAVVLAHSNTWQFLAWVYEVSSLNASTSRPNSSTAQATSCTSVQLKPFWHRDISFTYPKTPLETIFTSTNDHKRQLFTQKNPAIPSPLFTGTVQPRLGTASFRFRTRRSNNDGVVPMALPS